MTDDDIQALTWAATSAGFWTGLTLAVLYFGGAFGAS